MVNQTREDFVAAAIQNAVGQILAPAAVKAITEVALAAVDEYALLAGVEVEDSTMPAWLEAGGDRRQSRRGEPCSNEEPSAT